MAVAFVQKSAQLFADNASSITPSRSGVTAGNFVAMLVGASYAPAGSNTVATPTGGGTWSTAIAPAGPNTTFFGPAVAIFYKENAASGTHTGTVSIAAGSYAQATIIEFSGVATSSALDVTSNTGAGGASNLTSGNTGTTAATSVADSVALVIGHPEDTAGNTSALSSPAATGYTLIDTSSSNSVHVAADFGYKILTSTGTQSASWTWTGNSYFTGVIAVFKAAAAGGTSVTPGVAALALTGYAPTLAQTANQSLTPGVGSLTLTGYAPTISQPQAVSPGVGALSLTGFAPTVAQSANRGVSPGTGALVLAGYAPSIGQTANRAVVPGVGALSITGFAPVVTQQSSSPTLTPLAGQLILTGYAPTVAQTGAPKNVGGFPYKRLPRMVWTTPPRVVIVKKNPAKSEITPEIHRERSTIKAEIAAARNRPRVQTDDEDEDEAFLFI